MADVSDISSAAVPSSGAELVTLFFDSINTAKDQGILLPKPENFEAKLTEFMKLWGSLPGCGVLVDAATEAKMKNVAHFLGEALFGEQSCPDPKGRLTQDEMFFLKLFIELSCMIGGVVLKICNLPPSPGYEQLLKQKGFDSISARGMAHLIRHSGERQAKEQQLRLRVVNAIRGLAKNRTQAEVLDHAKFLVQIVEESSIVDTICCEVGLRETDILPFLRDLVAGKPINQQRMTEIIEVLGPALAVPRGPKISAASAAHEFLLEGGLPAKLGCSAYTLSDSEDDFIDPLTLATRREFSAPDFDPRPAHRRFKKRQLAKIG